MEQMKFEHLKHTQTTKGRFFHAEIYTNEEIICLINQCNKGASGLRNRALIFLLYRCGISVSEAIELLFCNYNPNESTIKIGKGNRHRIVGLDSQLKINLDLWLSKRKNLGISEEENSLVFCGISKHNFEKKIQPVYIRNLLKRLANKAGIKKRMNPNSIRHSFTYNLLNQGVYLKEIQSILGLSDPPQTLNYIQKINPDKTINTLKNLKY